MTRLPLSCLLHGLIDPDFYNVDETLRDVHDMMITGLLVQFNFSLQKMTSDPEESFAALESMFDHIIFDFLT